MRLTKPELAVVVFVAVIGISLLIPFVLHQRAAGRRLTCEDRLRRLAQAAQEYDDQHDALPGYVTGKGSDARQNWIVALLPHLTTADGAGGQHLQDARDALLTGKQGPTRLPELLCPGTAIFTSKTPLSFVGNCGMPDVKPADNLPPDWQANGLLVDQTVATKQRVTTSLAWLSEHDGTKVTILFSENVDAPSWQETSEAAIGFVWGANLVEGEPSPLPTVWPINQHRGQGDGSLKFARPSSEHVGGVNVVMASSTTQFLSEAVDYLVYQRLLTADGANVKIPGKDELLPKPWRHGE